MENYLKNYNAVDSNDPVGEAAELSREAQRLRDQASQTKDSKKQTQLLREAKRFEEYASSLQPEITARERQNIDRQREAIASANRNKSGMSDYASTKDQFNPRNDPDVWAQNSVTSERFDRDGKATPTRENFVWTQRNEKDEGLNRDLDIQDGKRRFGATPTAAINALHESNKGKNYSVGQTQPYYSTPESARRAAPYANEASYVGGKNPKYDKLDAAGQVLQPVDSMGYVPKATFHAPPSPDRANSAREQQLIKDSAANVAARESGNTPAHNAAYRAQTYQKEADRQRSAGDKQSADRWAKSAAEERAKASQLGYKGDFKNLSATQKPSTPKPAAPAASNSSKPADASGDQPSGNKPTYSMPVSSKPLPADRQAEEFKPLRSNTEASAASDQKKALESHKIGKNFWDDRAKKETDPKKKAEAQKEADRYAKLIEKTEKQIAEKQGAGMGGIKPLSKSDKDKKKGDSLTDPMEELIAGIPELNNSSAYSPTGGSGGSGGIAGFFTRDGKVIPITA